MLREHLPTRQLSHLGARAPGPVPDLRLLGSPYLSIPVPSCPEREMGTTCSEGVYFGALQAHATMGVVERGYA